SGPFGNFDQATEPTGIPAPMSDPQIGPTNVRLGPADTSGGGAFDVASVGLGDSAGLGGDFTGADVTDVGDRGEDRGGGGQFAFAPSDTFAPSAQVAGLVDQGSFAPDTMDMLMGGGGQQLGGDQTTTGPLFTEGGGGSFVGGGGGAIGGDFSLPGFAG